LLIASNPDQHNGGLLLVYGQPMMIESAPILTSMNTGPVRGTLIMGRYLDDSSLGLLSQAVGLPLELQDLDQARMPKDFQTAEASFTSSKPVITQSLNESYKETFFQLPDIYGNPIAVVGITDERTAYLQGKTAMSYAGLSFGIIGTILFATSAVLLDKIVLKRLTFLNKTVVNIRESKDDSKRVQVDNSKDELTTLSSNINGMLDVVEESQTTLAEHAQTLEKKVEERTRELSESQQKLKSILTASPDAIMALDTQGKIVESNEQLSKTCGSSREELVDKTATEFVVENDRKRILNVLSTIKPEEITRAECSLRKKDGSTYPAELLAKAITSNKEDFTGLVVIVRDLTEKKQIEERLIRSERLAGIGELAGMVGHDLRNPLTGIKNSVYMLEKKGASIPEDLSKQLFSIIDNCIEHSDKIINDLLDYARDVHLDVERVSLSQLVSNSLAMAHLPEKIKIERHVDDNILLKVDGHKMQRVFVNLARNAADAMPDGGTLTIRSKENHVTVSISFSDTGHGIPEEIASKLFRPLVTTKAQGMGFGLAICKRIVEAHQGTINVKTAKGKGTTFTVALPTEPIVEAESENFFTNLPDSLAATAKKDNPES